MESENFQTLEREEEEDVNEMARAWEVLKQSKLRSNKSPAISKHHKKVDFDRSQDRRVSTSKLSDLEYSEK